MSVAARAILIAIAVTLIAEPAFAYIGPGAGLSMIAAFWALLTAVFAALGFLLLQPIRRRLRRGRASGSTEATAADKSQGMNKPELGEGEVSPGAR